MAGDWLFRSALRTPSSDLFSSHNLYETEITSYFEKQKSQVAGQNSTKKSLLLTLFAKGYTQYPCICTS